MQETMVISPNFIKKTPVAFTFKFFVRKIYSGAYQVSCMRNLGTSECSSILSENYRSKDTKMQFDFCNQLLWPYFSSRFM
jgi:hypothetical protein